MVINLYRLYIYGKGAEKVKRGSTLIYNKWVKKVEGFPKVGELIDISDINGEYLGSGIYEGHGPVIARVLSHGRRLIDIHEALRLRVENALNRRRAVGYVESGFYRLINGDGDLISGLIIDVYNDLAVLQSSSWAIDKLITDISEILIELLGKDITIYNKSIQRNRKDIGLPLVSEFIRGGKKRTIISEGSAKFIVDIVKGQKTGFFLDQRENRLEFEKLIERGGRVLDLFSYTGGFGIHAGVSGAKEVIFVESDLNAIRLLKENIKLNGIESISKVLSGDVRDIMPKLMNTEQFDYVVVDPPAFIQSRSNVKEGMKAYYNAFKAAARLIKPGGIMFLSSCSYFLTKEKFLKLLNNVFNDLKREYFILGSLRGAARDHVFRAIDEHAEYLKAAFIYVD